MSDYKYEMQLMAEQAAEEEYEKDFYELPMEVRDKLYSEAMTAWTEKQYAKAESLRDDL